MLLPFRRGSRVESHLAEDERPIAGENMQPVEVPAEVGLALEEDVERQEVEHVERQVTRRRVVGIRDELLWVDVVHDVGQLLDQPCDHAGAHPAHDVGGHLVAERQREHLLAPASRWAASRTSARASRATRRRPVLESPTRYRQSG